MFQAKIHNRAKILENHIDLGVFPEIYLRVDLKILFLACKALGSNKSKENKF